jgi:hypothetical protein
VQLGIRAIEGSHETERQDVLVLARIQNKKCRTQMRNPDAERGGGGKITQNLITHQRINISRRILHEDRYYLSSPYCVDKISFWRRWQAKTVSYIVRAEPIKGSLS